MDGPRGGRDVDWVMRLPRGLVLVGGKKPQCGERPRMVLAWVGRREAEERQGDLRVTRLLRGTSRTGLTVGGLGGAGGLGGTLRDTSGLRGVGRSLPTVRLSRRRNKEIMRMIINDYFLCPLICQLSGFIEYCFCP